MAPAKSRYDHLVVVPPVNIDHSNPKQHTSYLTLSFTTTTNEPLPRSSTLSLSGFSICLCDLDITRGHYIYSKASVLGRRDE